MKRFILMVFVLIVFVFGAARAFAQQYTKDGEMLLPKEYREWVFLSAGIGMTYDNSRAPENPPFENVFVNPAAYQAFLKIGMWPDKTVMVLEVRRSEKRLSINKDGHVQTGVIVTEAHVKDNARGGWAFYQFPAGATQGKPFPKTADCFSCHEQSGAVDSTFVQFYPTLIDVARQRGTYKETKR